MKNNIIWDFDAPSFGEAIRTDCPKERAMAYMVYETIILAGYKAEKGSDTEQKAAQAFFSSLTLFGVIGEVDGIMGISPVKIAARLIEKTPNEAILAKNMAVMNTLMNEDAEPLAKIHFAKKNT